MADSAHRPHDAQDSSQELVVDIALDVHAGLAELDEQLCCACGAEAQEPQLGTAASRLAGPKI
ncbi:hypothetical protein G6O69_37105 [Pseudenhygromyxa sp. WMMC2535]|uniref:hypothetical protein n=1 Tax=Pseudenhygromyxa sp. WMMC2535 TaxID=2712867 RepID=UPI001594EE2A|nr:hypothetical protein [Pseudenhygromyxa sp. WMMC2535]NVB40318.1 hypothetical protein [Pseudenhygromyxa sp. WMMC2535]NVB43498.1 hypothetical protein [Pseudenhygromyxa sp. WMMC2535]